VREFSDLRTILSRNIKNAREALHITQAKLAEYADLSLSSVIDIERCRTWVSDKTLTNIARALNRDVYQLFVPPEPAAAGPDREKDRTEHLAALIHAQKLALRKGSDERMEELLRDILQLYGLP
jgi:transcriptional regulator with XRE-family HTH domain